VSKERDAAVAESARLKERLAELKKLIAEGDKLRIDAREHMESAKKGTLPMW